MSEKPAATLDDTTLARRIIALAPARDAAAEADLCRRLGPRIRLYGLRHLRDAAAAADLAQDVLLLLLQKLREGALREPERLASFVFGIARQRVVDGRRNDQRHARLLGAFPLDLPSTEDEIAPPVSEARLGPCLQALPERERAVLVMTFYDECPAHQVATELGLTEGNVRVIRHRGLARLRGCLDTGTAGASA